MVNQISPIQGAKMSLQKKNLSYLILLLFAAFLLTSCSPPEEIIVPCDVNDLIGAINDANANSDTTKLVLEANCTYPFTVKDNSDGGQGPNALPLITTKIIIEGNNATLDRSGTMFRYFFITDSGNLRLEDITLENGYALIYTGVQPNSRGGAIYNDGGALRAERSVFRLNSANDGEGGAIYNLGILTLEDTLFELNFSDYGGAIYNGGAMDVDTIVENATFYRNYAQENGGAIYNTSPESGYLIIGSTFEENHSYFHGGAIYTESADLNITSSEFIENFAGRNYTYDPDWGNGGAIYTQTGEVYIYQSQFDLQRANGVGGFLYGGPGSNIKLREVSSEASKACHGGGALYVEGVTEILQSTLKYNSVGGWAGWNFGDVSFFNECDGSHGGAIYNTGSLDLDSSLLHGNWSIEGDSDGIYNLDNLIIVNSTFHYDMSEENVEYRRQGVNNLANAELSFSTFVYNSLVNSGNMIVKDIVVAGERNGCNNSGTITAVGENVAVDPACPFSIILPSFGDAVIQDVLSDNGGPTLTNFVGDVSPLID
jgi:predicted outer membrane repeat protein